MENREMKARNMLLEMVDKLDEQVRTIQGINRVLSVMRVSEALNENAQSSIALMMQFFERFEMELDFVSHNLESVHSDLFGAPSRTAGRREQGKEDE